MISSLNNTTELPMQCKVINQRIIGCLFHYAHFLIDCLYPEILQGVYQYKEVIREKTIRQTIGNFHSIYTEVMNITNTELPTPEFDTLTSVPTLLLQNKEDFTDRPSLETFRHFIFSRYSIDPLLFDTHFPEILLIKRGERISLVDDNDIKQVINPTQMTTGKERREIDRIDEVELYLQQRFPNTFQSVFLEYIPFQQQVLYFNRCKIVIAIHGAGIANVLFCKENTLFIEISNNMHYEWFDTVFHNLGVRHIKCNENRLESILECLQQYV